jgi:hypothetical protein
LSNSEFHGTDGEIAVFVTGILISAIGFPTWFIGWMATSLVISVIGSAFGAFGMTLIALSLLHGENRDRRENNTKRTSP